MAQPRYYSEDDEMAERQPLGVSAPSPPPHRQFKQPPQRSYQSPRDPYDAPSSQFRSGAHPDSSFERRSQRRRSQEAAHRYAASGTAPNAYGQPEVSPVSPLHSSPQRYTDRNIWGQGTSYPPRAQQRPSPQSTVTPGADNFSNTAAGGMAGIALSIAEQNARESGLNAIHSQHPDHPYQNQGQQGQAYPERGMLTPHEYYSGDRASHSSLQGLNAGAVGAGYATPGQITPSRTGDIYTDDPYQNLSSHHHRDSTLLSIVNPNDIIDDDDDGLVYGRRGPRTSMLSIGSSHKSRDGRNGSGGVTNQYAPVNHDTSSDRASGGSGGGNIYSAGPPMGADGEKGAWQAGAVPKGSGSGKKWRLAIIVVVILAIIAGIVCGVLFGAVLKGHDTSGGSGGSSSGSTSTGAGDTQANGDLNSDSSEIQALMNNPDLRKVFPGMDYTPLNTQFPDCLKNPPSQNNITRDLAVLSQLTNVIRLYGTDCNQTQMLIHSINQLKLQDTVKVWLGVWQDGNATTNARQLSQMWDILDEYGESYFKGIIVANEILFRQEMNIATLGSLLQEVRANLTAKGMKLPVATSDLGDNWTSNLAAQSDAIMANIHPFFAGTKATQAADWTMYFWGNKTQDFLKKDNAMNIIAETGWPSQGGTACGNEWETDCPDKAVAGIDELNTFMEDWVCRSLDDGTEYFWFEAFDEPWKIRFNTAGKEWEDHWGLLTVDRKLKKGVKIPDCGGKRVS
ncbi:glycoside hydrolase family 17 protein [Chaetomium strumarium]|uniref:glucan endo-1,3-beta-D-glucosidase n=1 Tax=Chaetomium strumarium TaxID=1170767 RepID=A0AAJ0H3E3_9PEZI|nr:glycoside hydrolase family 17 protein [Chaetomium strumarium]